MAYLFDTDWVINLLAGKRQARETTAKLEPQRFAISCVTVAELYEGAFGAQDPAAQLAVLRTFLVSFPVIGLSDEIAERFAQVRTSLRRRGQLIPDFDLVIGATALQHDLTLLTFNVRHLSRIPGIKLYPLG